MIFSGDDNFFDEIKSCLTDAKSQVRVYKEVDHLNYSFATDTNLIVDNRSAFMTSLTSYLKDAKAKVDGHLGWKLTPHK